MRDLLRKNPWIGWTLCGVLFLACGFLWWDRSRGGSPFSPERMQEMVSIKYTDTGEVATMPRGRFEKLLREGGTKLDPSKGLINPKTGQPTGFLFNQKEWDESIARVNSAIDRARANLPESVRKSLSDAPGPPPGGPRPDGETAPDDSPKAPGST